MTTGQPVLPAEPDRGKQDVVSHAFTLTRDGQKLSVQIETPAAGQLAARPMLLLNFSTDAQSSLHRGRYGKPAQFFLAHGHRIASFDLPAHGERVDRHGKGIDGLCARVVAGEDPFALFVADGQAVIDECIRRGWAESGQIVVCGVSRAGYCALRLAAADRRIAAVTAIAPVTDWRSVREFSAVRDHPRVAELALTHFAAPLAGRRLFIVIGNSDQRVGTDACTRFVLALFDSANRLAIEQSRVRYLVVDDSPGHTVADRWRQEGIRYLLPEPASQGGQTLP